MANPSFVYNPPMTPYLDILYQDEDMVVAHKPSGLLSVPGKALEHRDSLISRVNTVYPTATVVHRLDMATSGILVLALNKDSHRHISKQFELRLTQKRYFARVHGHIEEDSDEVDLPLICDWPNRPKQNENIRIKILEAIKYVDLIILFSDKTPIRLIKKIKPNLLVKGSDYKEKELAGYNLIKNNGGTVKIIKKLNNSNTLR